MMGPTMNDVYQAGRQSRLSVADARAMLALVAQACDPGIDAMLADRRRTLGIGLAQLVEADGWIGYVRVAPEDLAGTVRPTLLVDGGRRDASGPTLAPDVALEEQLHQIVQEVTCEALDSKETLPDSRQAITWTCSRHTTMSRPEEPSLASDQHGGDRGRDHFLISLYPLPDRGVSAIGLVRWNAGRPFDDRDRAIVHAVWQRTDWLHRCNGELDIGSKAIVLTLRERQVVELLLAGATKRRAAAQLGLSEHTVGDYIKSIYRKLQVKSRLELMTKLRTVESVGPDRALDSAF
jgi:DNA-binding CsgD family transcriptional regulator